MSSDSREGPERLMCSGPRLARDRSGVQGCQWEVRQIPNNNRNFYFFLMLSLSSGNEGQTCNPLRSSCLKMLDLEKKLEIILVQFLHLIKEKTKPESCSKNPFLLTLRPGLFPLRTISNMQLVIKWCGCSCIELLLIPTSSVPTPPSLPRSKAPTL